MANREFKSGFVNKIICGDCLELMKDWPDNCVDLVFGSPPYEDCRSYGIDFALKGQDWVDWMVKVIKESLRVCKGLVAFVVEGRTKAYRWSAVPALLMADLHRAGIHLRKPPIFARSGIPGSGGPDWLRNDYEFIICCSQPGRLPWSDNIALGQKCRYPTGGPMSNRNKNGREANAARSYGKSPHTKRRADGMTVLRGYTKPNKANPGNIIKCIVGGGMLGSPLAHENEAAFPEKLANFFIESFCPPGGIVLDPFIGSGTTAAAAYKSERHYVAIDIRQSQVGLTGKRIRQEHEKIKLFTQPKRQGKDS